MALIRLMIVVIVRGSSFGIYSIGL